jgi:hypothetical protein
VPVRVDRRRDHVIDSLVTKGDEIEAPRRIILLYVNRLRYSFSASVDVAIIQNPTIPGGFTAPDLVKGLVPVAGRASAGAPGPRRGGFDGQFDEIKTCIAGYVTQVADTEQSRNEVDTSIQMATQEYETVLNGVPSLLSKQQAEDLRNRTLRDSAKDGVLRKALNKPFPSDHARVLTDAMSAFADTLTEIEKTDDYKAWIKTETNLTAYLAQKATLKQTRDALEPLMPGKQADTDAIVKQRRISYWTARFADFSTVKIGERVQDATEHDLPDVTDEDLALAVDTSCRTIFGRGKTSTVNYSATDLFGSDSQTATKTVVATCLPVLSVTAGIGFSTLGDQTPAFVASKGEQPPGGGAAAVVRTFGYTDRSSVKPLYMAQVNARLAGKPAGVSFHGTFGVGAVNRTDTTNVEFLAAGTVALKSVFFVSTGVHFGRQPRIGGGFQEGDLKPAALESVPVENAKGLRPGFAVSVTFPVIR